MISKTDFTNILHFRHATKEFDPQRTISNEDFQFILEAARLSPSSFGFEPWNIIVLQNKELREEIRQFAWGAKKQLPTASHLTLITAKTNQALQPDGPYLTHIQQDILQYPTEAIEKRQNRIHTFFTEDFKMTQSERALWDWSGKQAYIALANMMTAAAAIGIDSCPIEGFQAEPVEKLLKEKEIIDGENNRLVVMAVFGYRVHNAQSKKRRPMEEIVRWVK